MWRIVQEASEEYLGAKNKVTAKQERKVSSFSTEAYTCVSPYSIEKSLLLWCSMTYVLHAFDGLVIVACFYTSKRSEIC